MNRSLLTVMTAFAGIVGPASAETITVCASGCDYTSIITALESATDGDVIQLSPETYDENEVIRIERDRSPETVTIGERSTTTAAPHRSSAAGTLPEIRTRIE